MATVVFIGSETDNPPEITAFGIRFPLGKPVAVDDREHAHALFKFRGNPHFVVHDQSLEYVRMAMMGLLVIEQPPLR